MKKVRLILFLTLFAVGVIVMAASATPAAFGEGAQVIIDRVGCYVPDDNFVIHQVDGHGTIVWTNNEQGILNVACSGKLPDGAALPDKAIKLRPGDWPGRCWAPTDSTWTQFVFTDDWSINLTPSGQAQLICKIH